MAQAENGKKTKLFKKLLEVQKAAKPVKKDGTNPHFGYTYASAESVIWSLRQIFLEQGLVVLPSVIERIPIEGKGVKGVICNVTMSFEIFDAETGESVKVNCCGDGYDTLDKSAYKAITGCTKRGLMMICQVPMSDDPEKDIYTKVDGNDDPPNKEPEKPKDKKKCDNAFQMIADKEHEVYDHPRAITNARKKHLADKNGEPTDILKDATKESLKAYFKHMKEKKDAEPE